MPSITSEWPEMYLVPAWIEISTPCSNARKKYGVPQVVSASTATPFACAAAAIAVDDAIGLLIGQHDHVEPVAQRAGLDVGIVQRGVGELVLLEHPPRPPFVHAACPWLIQRDPRRLEAVRRRAGRISGRGHLESKRSRHRLHL